MCSLLLKPEKTVSASEIKQEAQNWSREIVSGGGGDGANCYLITKLGWGFYWKDAGKEHPTVIPTMDMMMLSLLFTMMLFLVCLPQLRAGNARRCMTRLFSIIIKTTEVEK